MSNPTEAWSIQPGGLARELRRLREEAGMTGTALAEKLGWPQPRVSKIENGRQLPSEDDIRSWVWAAGGDNEIVTALVELRSRANAISREWRHSRTGGQEAIQQTYDERVRAATVIRNAEVSTVPGLLQTREYARHQKWQAVKLIDGFDADGIEASLDGLARRQEVLYDASKRFEFVVTEAALRLRYSPRDVMTAQLDRLLGATFPRDNFRFGVIPFDAELPLVPQNRFMILDDVVLVEHFAGDEEWKGDRVDVYSKAMDLLLVEAVFGDDARRLIMAAMEAFTSKSV
jgi:DNA-binding XRE family transcriptional regulator